MAKYGLIVDFLFGFPPEKILRVRPMLFLPNQHAFVILLVAAPGFSSRNTPHLTTVSPGGLGGLSPKSKGGREGLTESCVINISQQTGTCSGISI